MPKSVTLSGVVHVPNPEMVQLGQRGDIRILPPTPENPEIRYEVYESGWHPMYLAMKTDSKRDRSDDFSSLPPKLARPYYYFVASYLSSAGGTRIDYEDYFDSYVFAKGNVRLENLMAPAYMALYKIALKKHRRSKPKAEPQP